MAMRGTTQRLETTIYDGPGGELVDPNSISLRIRQDETVVFTATPSEIQRISEGVYYYDWNIPLDFEPDTYTVIWGAVIPGESSESYGYDTVSISVDLPGVPGFDTCDWPLDETCLGESWDGLSDEVKTLAVGLASTTLRRLTAYRVGVCPITMRPDIQRGSCLPVSGPYGLYAPNSWITPGIMTLPGGCEVALPRPVTRVDQVRCNGVVLDPADYEVQNHSILVYTGSDECPFPANQDMSLPLTEVGTMSVTYLNAHPVDRAGARAAAFLAREFAKSCTNPTKCQLPNNITGIVRQGVSYELVAGAFPDGLTNIREVDAYTALWNRKGRAPATLFDPGAPNHRITTS